jgi:hypothetical protein
LIDGLESKTVPDELNTVFDITPDEVADVEKNCEAVLRDCCLRICQLFQQPGAHCVRKKFRPLTEKNQSFLDLSSTKLKNGDVIFINSGGLWIPSVLTITSGKTIINAKGAQRDLEILIPKASFMSSVITIISVLTTTISSQMLADIFDRSTCVTGVAGSGKTTDIVKVQEANYSSCITAACTSGGVKSLIAKLPRDSRVTSVEKLSYNKCDKNCLIIDEATLLHPWKIATLVSNPGVKLHLYGDPLQIPAVDFNISGGSRINTNALRYALKLTKNSRELTKTYRFGNPLVKELSKHPVLNSLETAAKHETEFETFHLPTWNVDSIVEATGKARIILVFYNDPSEIATILFG